MPEDEQRVITADVESHEPRSRSERARGTRWKAYGSTLLIVAGSTATASLMERHFDPANLTMIYLLGVVVCAVAFGRGPAIVAAVLSVAVFDFVFVPPRFNFSVSDTQYLVSFAVMLVVATVIGTLTAWLREQRESARHREQQTAALHRLSRDLALRSTTGEVVIAAADRIADVLHARVTISLGETASALRVVAGDSGMLSGENDCVAARRAYENRQTVGSGSWGCSSLHLPLEAGTRMLGVLSLRTSTSHALEDLEWRHLLRALANQTALAIERCRLAENVERMRLQAETERTRSALLSSVSHDLRTPLASITGAATSLRDGSVALPEATRLELADTIAEEAVRLNRLIGNLLDMTRLESGNLRLRKEWHSLEEVVGAALARLEASLGDREVRLSLPEDLLLVPLDDVLFEQVVRNLVENAVKYAVTGPIEISAGIDGGELRFQVADRGPGFESGEEHRVFEKFYRGANAQGRPGVGLGLPICQAIVQAHGGTMEARNRSGGGALFMVRLPVEGEPPAVEQPQLGSPSFGR